MFVEKETNLLAPAFLGRLVGFDCGPCDPVMVNCSFELIFNSQKLAP